jgi:GT2 family glycosyltransferase
VLSVLLCIPTLNGENSLPGLLASLRRQTVQPDSFLAIDSGSDDCTVGILRGAGFRVQSIRREEFNHGGTRQSAAEMFPVTDLIVFLTQDAILAHPEALENLLACFADERVGAAYGRQLPRNGADPIAAHARLFNYPPQSRVKSLVDAPRLGLKTAFISNSFAAYRRSALTAVGGFPLNTIGTEDTFVAAKMLIAGWKVAYCAEAKVYHSHHYSWLKEFRRYFDIGVFYGRECWIGRAFGHAEGEGRKFVISEIKYLLEHCPLLIPYAIIRTAFKYLGYKLGMMEAKIPVYLKRHLSMNKKYWYKNKCF